MFLWYFSQDLSGRARRPFLQRRPSTPRKQVPILPTVQTQEDRVISEQPRRRLKIPVIKEDQNENELNLEEQLFANILQQGQNQVPTNSFRGRQPINNPNLLQRTQRPKSQFRNRDRNPSKSRTFSSAINDPALRNRQRSRTRLRTRPGSSTPSSNRIHPFSTTTKAPIITTTSEEPSTIRFDLQTTLDLEEIFPIITSEAPQPDEFEPREQFPHQPAQNTFVTRARAPIERLLPTTTSRPIIDNEYGDYYEYYDEDQQPTGIPHPPPVKSIDDYDLFPLNNKVRIVIFIVINRN